MRESPDDETELRAWQLEPRDVDRIIYTFLLHSTIDRFPPYIVELRPPLSEAELDLLGRKFRSWVRDWVTKRVPDKAYESAFQKHVRTAKQVLVEMLGKDRSAVLLS